MLRMSNACLGWGTLIQTELGKSKESSGNLSKSNSTLTPGNTWQATQVDLLEAVEWPPVSAVASAPVKGWAPQAGFQSFRTVS